MGTQPNTVSSHFMSVASTKESCKSDKKEIEKHCKPTPERNEKDNNGKRKPPRKKGGVLGKINKTMETIDEKTKDLAGYERKVTRGKPNNDAIVGNAWMDEHCTGLWLKPHESNLTSINELTDTYNQKLTELKESVTKLNSAGEIFSEMLSLLWEESMWSTLKIGGKFLGKSAIKAIVGGASATTGAGLVVTGAMAAWTIKDLYDTIGTVAELLGDKGAALKQAFNEIGNLDETVAKLQKELVDDPVKGLTNTMTTLAKINPCVRARKCLLVPYKNTKSKKKTVKDGNGCCPGQTGHHIMPNAMFKDKDNKSVCPGYNYNEAPVMCLEGTNNAKGWGSHGSAHSNLEVDMKHYRDERFEKNQNTDVISYKEGSKICIDAVREAAAKNCDPECLQAQLDHHYNQCKDLEAEASDENEINAGTVEKLE
ncbi:HNH/endonuclease VII fold toxin-2 domain-containing protein, partial [Gilvimarinus japonicus]